MKYLHCKIVLSIVYSQANYISCISPIVQWYGMLGIVARNHPEYKNLRELINFYFPQNLQKTFFFFLKKKGGFTPCKAEPPLRGMAKEAQKDYSIQEICFERTYN